jgi:hypothetical protein
MKASTQKTKKRYMSDEDFAELQESLSEAVAHAKGEPNDCRVTTIALPPQPRHRSKANIAPSASSSKSTTRCNTLQKPVSRIKRASTRRPQMAGCRPRLNWKPKTPNL